MKTGGGLTPPVEFADAVETYARKYGKHGTMRFVPPPVNVWIVEFELRANDPRRSLWQSQRAKEEPKEVVYLWRDATPQEIARARGQWHRVGYKLDELGVSGLVQFLDRTNLFSGRGEYGSLTEAVKDQANKQEQGEAKELEDARQGAVEIGMDKRRQLFKIPYLNVGIDLKKTPTTASGEK